MAVADKVDLRVSELRSFCRTVTSIFKKRSAKDFNIVVETKETVGKIDAASYITFQWFEGRERRPKYVSMKI